MDPISNIPMELRQSGEAAVKWLNEKNNNSFYLTGIVDYESALNTKIGQDYEFGLVLCNGEVCVPKYSNMSGAGARPEPRYVRQKINQAVATFSEENACYDEKSFMGSEELSWFKFLLVMVGHGWFIRPKAFPLLRDGSKDKVSPKDAMRRWQFFLIAWVLALVVFPVKWVAVVTVLWMILLLPGLREIHRQFQNE
jgi:hypothetical protein